ncbi:hypothetical protein EG328_003005 [Venturia inaequalis]|uniref:homocitrate synthase n=1 Tax=Venturia inaequalis TaxID=5025 RepID=A0A8H3UUX6_VENIN|nr:hypothetical protein EG328_003005 [Venturia inaequalis]
MSSPNPPHFTQPTTNYWQEILPSTTVINHPPYQYSVPVTLPDNRILNLPIRQLSHDPTQAVASLLVNQASMQVVEELGTFLADLVRPYKPDMIIGLPTLGLTLAPIVAQKLGHTRYIPMGYSKKFWYTEDLSTAVSSITSPGIGEKRVYLDPHLLPLIRGKRVAIIDDAAGDFLSNVGRFKIIESTLREGEQFANAYFDTATKIKIAKALDNFGVDFIELSNPASSPQSRSDCEKICALGLKSKILTHIRCHMDDARIACSIPGLTGVDVVIGTSSFLMEHSHGKDIAYIQKAAVEVISFIKDAGLEVRFSTEDSFRSNLVDVLSIYSAVDKIVYDLVRTLRGVVSCDIECHFHDDTGCAIANAYCALEAGATHIDTSVIGIGERNGITSLGGLMARMIVADRDYVKSKYNLAALKDLEQLVADIVEINIPFNNPITGFCAFTHKAGIHAKAILNNPSTYEILSPSDFGLTRYVHFSSRLTGWNAIKSRAEQLGYQMTDEEYKQCTVKVKALADVKKMSLDDTDAVIRSFHKMVNSDSPLPVKNANIENSIKDLENLDLNGVSNGKTNGHANGNGHAEVPPPTEQMKEFLEGEPETEK